jgi:hypothetical protein
MKPRQYVVLKMDDLNASWWGEWKILTDIIRTMDVKAGLGIFASSLLEGDSAYDTWIADIVSDGRFELWSHGFTGHGPNHEPGREHQGTPYDFQLASFDRTRQAVLERCDLVMRTYSEHWHGGDATTVRVFNEDPFLRVWMCWAWAQKKERIRDVNPDRRLLDDMPVKIEFADPANWTPGYVNFSEYEKNYAGHENDPYLVLQGHPWSWSDTSKKPDRTGAVLDRWAEFRAIVDFLKSRGATFVTPYEYYRIVRGYTGDTKPPSVPTGLTLSQDGAGPVKLAWTPSADPGSGVDCYKIYRDGRPVGLSVGTSYTEDLPGLVNSTAYQVVAVNKAEVCSARSAAVTLASKT